MKTSRILFLLLSVALLAPVVSGTLTRAATDEEGSPTSLSKNLSVFTEVLSLIRRAYVDETSMEELLAGALNGSTDALDPMATFVPVTEVDRYREVRRVGRLHSGLTVAKDRGIAFVVAVDPDSPGNEAGLQQGDVLAKVNGLSTRRMPLWRLQSLLTQEPGTELSLEVLRRGQTLDFDLVLGTYETLAPLRSEASGQAVLRISRFEQEDLEGLRGILAQMVGEGVDRLLIDVRGVAGGAAETAYAMAGLFADGNLGELNARGDARVRFQGSAVPLWQGRLVLLIDNGTQGAAEIFASVLHQRLGARLVGQRSFGLAGHQRMVSLSDGSQLLLTDAFYSGPDGELIDRSLIPDVSVAGVVGLQTEDDAEAADPILDKGIEVLQEDDREEAREVA